MRKRREDYRTTSDMTVLARKVMLIALVVIAVIVLAVAVLVMR